MISSAYRLPAEFETHRATWLLWPSRTDNWRSKAYFGRNDIIALASLIADFEPVRLGVPEAEVERLRRQLPRRVLPVPMKFDDIWVRDTGPMTLVSEGHPAIALNWKFNSWGGLFSEVADDNRVASEIARYEGLRVVNAPIVLEGGSIITDGRGTIITTEECVLADNRNPGMTRADAEGIFRHFLNAKAMIWLPFGLNHDEAGGHVDNVCAFASERVLLLGTSSDKAHPSYDRVRAAKDVLSRSTNASGQPFTIVEVPLPEPTCITAEEAAGFEAPEGTIVRTAGSPLAPSHVNLYITKQAVFVPTFNDSADHEAMDIIGSAFQNRLIIPYQSREFLLGGGAIHCLTRDIPV